MIGYHGKCILIRFKSSRGCVTKFIEIQTVETATKLCNKQEGTDGQT